MRTLGMFVFLAFVATAQAYQEGDVVVLVERDAQIPAHPASGDSSVTFRFASGSTAVVLGVDNWIRVRGETVDGTEGIGWIVKKYISNVGTDGVPDLAWCPGKGSAEPHPAGRLRIATWNLGNLHAEDGKSTYGPEKPSVKRSDDDYARIRCYVRLFDPDVLAVQEVDGKAALARVVDTDIYDLHVSSRPRPKGMGGQQNTGFAFKKGLNVEPKADVKDLDVSNGALRYGTRIDVTVNGQVLKLLNVHLKSGCFSSEFSGSSCSTQKAQIDKLETWIDAAARGEHPFIVLGDFNRSFNTDHDTVWADLDDGDPANADLTSITKDKPISCRDNRFTTFIDHIVFDRRSIEFADASSFRHVSYRQQDSNVWDKISDHCPVIVEVRVP